MKEIVNKNECCGCCACVNICPKKAIVMEENDKGFNYPVIDQIKCINCGMCKNVCPILNNKKENVKKLNAYACFNNNFDERLNSSSGGIFVLIAKEIIKRNGVVFGAAFDNSFMIRHSFVEKESDLKKIMGSKYTQSLIENSYKKVKEFLDEDRYVLFTGTPCQIEGLKSFLRKDFKKLYTQDIVCHGVPSPKVWKKYLDYQKYKYDDDISSISFRNKSNGWTSFGMNIEFNTKNYNLNHQDDLFMKMFLSNLCLRDSCYHCHFKKKYRESDITLADYWGINNIHKEMNDDYGISLVVINSNKGKELFESIKKNIVFKETNLDAAIKYNPAMINSVNISKNRNSFFENIDKVNFQKLAKKYVPTPSILSRMKKTVKKIKHIIK